MNTDKKIAAINIFSIAFILSIVMLGIISKKEDQKKRESITEKIELTNKAKRKNNLIFFYDTSLYRVVEGDANKELDSIINLRKQKK